MSSRLLNVRLDPQRLRKAQALRQAGIPLSDVVREAIDRRFEAMRRPRGTREVKAAVERIFEQHPDPADLPPRSYDVHDGPASRAAIVRRRGRRRP